MCRFHLLEAAHLQDADIPIEDDEEVIATEKIHGTVRFSLGPFSTDDHINKAIEAVGEIASMKN